MHKTIVGFFPANDTKLPPAQRLKPPGAMSAATLLFEVRLAKTFHMEPSSFINGTNTDTRPHSTTGDLYGGAHYLQSSSATLTAQGRAIREASSRFGDGATLPFTPCKRGYLPFNSDGERMVACSLHHAQRWKRLLDKNGKFSFRKGEVNLNDAFWQDSTQSGNTTVQKVQSIKDK